MPTILGANTLSSGYEVANSLRFNGDNFLQRNNPSSNSTDGTKGTFSFWVKRDKFPNESQVLVHQADSSPKRFALQISNGDQFIFSIRNDAESVDIDGTTTLSRLYNDTTAWIHFLFNYDTSAGTNGCKLFVNGAEQALSYSATLPQNFVMTVNTNGFNNHTIGRDSTQSSNFWTGYMTEVMFVDGQQLAPTQFGEYDEDSPSVWKPINISGINVGNLGYYLDFEDSGNLGNDVKGVGDFSETNCAASDQSTDTCTNNFATMNSLILGSGTTLTEGALQINPGTNSTGFHSASTLGVSTGKWYWEAKLVSGTKGAFGIIFDGSSGHVFEHQRNDKMPGGFSGNDNSWGYKPGNAGNVENNAGDITFSGVTATSSNILGFAMDLDNGALYIHKDGTYMNSGNPASGASKTGAIDISGGDDGFVFPAYGDSDTGASPAAAYNFGNPPYSESGGESDADGHGNFNQSVPSGYFALCSKNLAEYG